MTVKKPKAKPKLSGKDQSVRFMEKAGQVRSEHDKQAFDKACNKILKIK